MKAMRKCTLGLVVLGLAIGVSAAAYAADEGWLGVMLQPLTGDLKEAMSVGKDVEGVVVAEVVAGSPAEAAGFEKGDILVEIDGITVASTDAAIAQVKGHAPGDKVKMVAVRDGKREVMTAVLGKREALAEEAPEAVETKDYYDLRIPRMERIFEDFAGEPGGYLGVTVHDVSADLAPYFGVREGEGVLVLEVLEGTPAEDAGLKAGDVIIKVDGEDVTDAGELVSCLGDREPGEQVDVTFKRNRETRRATVDLAESPNPARVFIKRVVGREDAAPPCGGSGPGNVEVRRQMMMPGDRGAAREELKAEIEELRQEIEQLKQEMKK